MTYKITIQEIVTDSEKNYPSTKDIYEQTIEDLDVLSVIKAANNLVQLTIDPSDVRK